MLSFKTIRIDNVSQVSDEDISHENLEYMHGTGIAISTGRDRMGEKKYHYRHGVQTALGDIEDSVWIALVKKLIEKETANSSMNICLNGKRQITPLSIEMQRI